MTWAVKYWMLLLALATTLYGCTPALNWRQVNTNASGLTVLLPCKPDHATRMVMMRVVSSDVETSLSLQGCEASNMQFTFGDMAVPLGLTTTEAIQAWRLASLAALHRPPTDAVPQSWAMSGPPAQTLAVRANVVTEKIQVQRAWFAYGGKIYQAAVYGSAKEKGLSDAAETYFSGIKLP
ncbi:hypothetical protein [Limnohabitans sp.]|uniref:hypothetical protein n=1 Tax=Limnohabitans sp. TaxID=1907725 RepID=UPI00286F7077|nr:hypothetical protein [Limnohabitans sp.]